MSFASIVNHIINEVVETAEETAANAEQATQAAEDQAHDGAVVVFEVLAAIVESAPAVDVLWFGPSAAPFAPIPVPRGPVEDFLVNKMGWKHSPLGSQEGGPAYTKKKGGLASNPEPNADDGSTETQTSVILLVVMIAILLTDSSSEDQETLRQAAVAVKSTLGHPHSAKRVPRAHAAAMLGKLQLVALQLRALRLRRIKGPRGSRRRQAALVSLLNRVEHRLNAINEPKARTNPLLDVRRIRHALTRSKLKAVGYLARNR